MSETAVSSPREQRRSLNFCRLLLLPRVIAATFSFVSARGGQTRKSSDLLVRAVQPFSELKARGRSNEYPLVHRSNRDNNPDLVAHAAGEESNVEGRVEGHHGRLSPRDYLPTWIGYDNGAGKRAPDHQPYQGRLPHPHPLRCDPLYPRLFRKITAN